jgi:hypothetical protein
MLPGGGLDVTQRESQRPGGSDAHQGHRAGSRSKGAVRGSPPALIIDDTTAHVTVAVETADALLDWFQAAGIGCRLRRGAGVAGRDLVDFGDPSAAEEVRIRALFDQWQRGQHSLGKPPERHSGPA